MQGCASYVRDMVNGAVKTGARGAGDAWTAAAMAQKHHCNGNDGGFDALRLCYK